MAAAGVGWRTTGAVVASYELATIATMVVLVTAAHAGVRALRMPWIDRHSHAVAGAVIITLGIAMAVLGI
jgi:hypothetical protein